MNKKLKNSFFTLLNALFIIVLFNQELFAQQPVKVFILAGQSNMQGQGEITKGEKGNLTWLVNNDKTGKYAHLINKDGTWKKRNDVYVYNIQGNGDLKTGELSVGYGVTDETIGPELEFGNITGDFYKEKVLIIKTAWGGKSLAVNFCSPGAISDSGYNRIPASEKDTGYYYVKMLATINEVLDSLPKYVPGYHGEGYQIMGFGWHQGWNDRVTTSANEVYEKNMVHFIKDVRRDLGTPNLPFVIATTGMAGWKEKNPRALSLMKAQLAMANYPEFKGNVSVVDTRSFWREIEESPSNQVYHWCRNAESYCLIGEAMGKAMLGLLKKNTLNKVYPRIRKVLSYNNKYLTPTPPMGWNSWNAFEKEINEKKIMRIADIMVSSGMRDAGYKFLVIDDAWMGPQRDTNGELVSDSVKFPGGMKAVGDYIHSKGLKFGIYECRGKLTCQQLPGSFKHEQTDMNTFAKWGVDYIKLDACFAESNGRLSTEDFAIYHQAIKSSGRSMVLSISDFGNGAWAWGGKKYAQLWRTSGDIYPFMSSVYHCAETSGGSGSIHPAFNGLWQFSGPDSWNDPDMLQVGNLGSTVEDRVHFSLWCILSAPLMAGNDLRIMTDTIKNILTAPEVIAINQDSRAQQGYKVYNKDNIEVYNKPLSDGTTAVLILNKGKNKKDVTVNWSQIGLKGTQKVRDLWQRKDLGNFKNSYTVKNLGQNDHLLIKVGTEGGKPIKGPTPIPEELYTIKKEGVTFLSDIYYLLKKGNTPKEDKAFNGKNIEINGKMYKKGLGCKSLTQVMYRLNGKAERFQATIGIDNDSPEAETGVFKILVQDNFGGRVIYNSGKMKKGDKEIKVDIDVKNLDFIMLDFSGKNVFGNWANPKVSSK